MKQGINFELPIKFNINLSEVEKIEFKFVQSDRVKRFDYPSDDIVKVDDTTLSIFWTMEDTYKFRPNKEILMDTRIFISGSNVQPQTNIVSIKLNKTLFDEGEE